MLDSQGAQSGRFIGTLEKGKATGQGVLEMGEFGADGKLKRPLLVYSGHWRNGLPNGGGKLEVYGEDGRLSYFLTGSFTDGTVDGPFLQFHPKNGAWESKYNDRETQQTLAID